MDYQKKYLLVKSYNDSNKLYGYILLEKDAGIWFSASFYFLNEYAKIYVFNNYKFSLTFEYLNFMRKKLHMKDLDELSFVIVLSDSILIAGAFNEEMINFALFEQRKTLSSNCLVNKIVDKIFDDKNLSLYEKIKKPLKDLMLYGCKDDFLSSRIPNGHFVKIDINNSKDIIGVINRDNENILVVGYISNHLCYGKDNTIKILYGSHGEYYILQFYDILTGRTINDILLN